MQQQVIFGIIDSLKKQSSHDTTSSRIVSTFRKSNDSVDIKRYWCIRASGPLITILTVLIRLTGVFLLRLLIFLVDNTIYLLMALILSCRCKLATTHD
jgi:hypothetical protein